tara:strand:- start:396 stop:911 length:516 start_codon:yes stop_codon:yes gene_type:complete
MQRIGQLVDHINKKHRRKRMGNTETYTATVKGVKDIHTEEDPVKYWLSVELENGTDRKLYVDQNCRHIQKGQKVTVTGYPIKKPGSNNQTCTKIETDGEAPPQAIVNATARSNGVKSVANTMDVWKEKYRLTMSNLIAASLSSGKEVDFDAVDKMVRKILNAQYDGDEAPF